MNKRPSEEMRLPNPSMVAFENEAVAHRRPSLEIHCEDRRYRAPIELGRTGPNWAGKTGRVARSLPSGIPACKI